MNEKYRKECECIYKCLKSPDPDIFKLGLGLVASSDYYYFHDYFCCGVDIDCVPEHSLCFYAKFALDHFEDTTCVSEIGISVYSHKVYCSIKIIRDTLERLLK